MAIAPTASGGWNLQMNLRFGSVLAFASLGLVDAAEPTGRPDTRPVQIVQVEPIYPPELKAQRVVGAVQLHGIIDEEGNVRDLVVTSASQEAFGRSALAAVAQWKYRPGTKEGRPRAIRVGFPLEFRLTSQELAEWEGRRDREVLPPGPPTLAGDELDEWPALQKEIPLKRIEVLRANKQMGEAVLQLVVDEQGVPRDVHTLATTHVECAAAAEEAARRWQFKPGRKDGQAVRCTLEVSLVFFPEYPEASGLRVRPGVRTGLDGMERLSLTLREARDAAKFPGMKLPKVRKRPDPEYPQEMGDRRQPGQARVQFIIDERGRVSHVQIMEKTNDFFAIMVERATSHWEFEPARLNGKPVACRAEQRVEFRIR
jgi:TonB family protein